MCTPYGYFDTFVAGLQSSSSQLEQLFSDISDVDSFADKQNESQQIECNGLSHLSQYSLDSVYANVESEDKAALANRKALASKATFKERNANFLKFPQKLWNIVNCCRSEAIKWGPSGDSIVINYDAFQEEYLGENRSVFKTRNFASFIRQLNLYGFRKVNNSNSQLNSKLQLIHEFKHNCFKRGNEPLLAEVTRKYGSPPSTFNELSVRTRTATNSLPFRTIKRNFVNFKKGRRLFPKVNNEPVVTNDNKVEKCQKVFDDLMDKQREAYKSKTNKFARFTRKKRLIKPKRRATNTVVKDNVFESTPDETKPLIICEDPIWISQSYSQSSGHSSANVNVIMDPTTTPTKAQSMSNEIVEELIYDSVLDQFDHLLAGGDSMAISTNDSTTYKYTV
ncbi:Heat shock factor protein 5-like protein [Leptotrombidium deliense]|uniref:Heat shock factor protein 5-like protein n=1 Tax=Leptotrombidium deliense TaxID=299467 RepID=A0A443SPL0_9ACAR|nr:Heat shock factor protein 5-like protein [Leptotrombidium deliense]